MTVIEAAMPSRNSTIKRSVEIFGRWVGKLVEGEPGPAGQESETTVAFGSNERSERRIRWL